MGEINRTVVLAVETGGKQDVSETKVLWKETKGVPEVPSPLVWQGRIYLIRSGGILVCRDLETGKLIYENRIDSPGGIFCVASAGRWSAVLRFGPWHRDGCPGRRQI